MAKKAGPVTLKSSRYRAVLGDPNNPDDAAAYVEVEVRSRSADEFRLRQLFTQHKAWGPLGDDPFRMQAGLVWAGLIRTHQIAPDTTWDAFEASLIEWQLLDTNEEAPTQPAPEAG
jgi:hypothetical protein